MQPTNLATPKRAKRSQKQPDYRWRRHQECHQKWHCRTNGEGSRGGKSRLDRPGALSVRNAEFVTSVGAERIVLHQNWTATCSAREVSSLSARRSPPTCHVRKRDHLPTLSLPSKLAALSVSAWELTETYLLRPSTSLQRQGRLRLLPRRCRERPPPLQRQQPSSP